MKFYVQLLKEWSHGGKTYAAGQLMRVDKALADELVGKGIAKMEGDQVEPVNDDKDDSATKAASGNDETAELRTQLEAAQKRLDATDKLLQKMAVTPDDDGSKVASMAGNAGKGPSVVKEMWEDDPTLGYGKKEAHGPGLFLLDVMHAVKGDFSNPNREKHYRETQKHLQRELYSRPEITSVKGVEFKAVGSDEHSTVEMSYGGALVPVEYRMDVMTQDVMPSISRSNGAMVVPVTGASIIFPVTKDFDRSGGLISGVQVYRDHERVAATSSRAEFFQFQQTPQRCTGATHMTGYLLAQAPQVGEIVLNELQKAMVQKENREHVKGDGGGEATGVLNQTGAYSATRTTSGKIEPDDIVEMYARQFNPSNAVWLASWSSFGEIMLMTKTIGTAGSLVVMQNVTDGPALSIMGRPVIFNEFSPALASKGDLMFVDFSQYMIADSGYRKNDRTMFVRFLEDQDTFRLIQYNTANSHWPSTITNDNGYEKSPFVNLAA